MENRPVLCACLLLASLAVPCPSVAREDWSAAVSEDLKNEVRPGGVAGRPFWNGNATMFMYPPAFDFKTVRPSAPGYEIVYRFIVHDAAGLFHFFEAKSPTSSLAPVWAKLPTGYTTVVCRAQDGNDRAEITVGTRAFWKSAPFTGHYPGPKRPYAEASRLALEYVLNAPSVKYFLEKGELDPSFKYNVYPTKTLTGLIDAGCALARLSDTHHEEAVALACKAADWLIAHSEPQGSPLAHFPPTYQGTGETAGTYAGQVMLSYPAHAARAYLDLFDETKKTLYLKEAEAIAALYLKLQGEDGVWPLKMRLADGTTVGSNRLVPIGNVIPLMTRLAKMTGREEYRTSAQRAFANLERTRVAMWNWEGQFEDVEPNERYRDLTKHDACATAIYLAEEFPNNSARIALARELLRFAEDQFVCWEKPFAGKGYTAASAMLDLDTWRVPGVLEQYYWYNPIDSSASKLIRTYLALWRVERKPLDLAKAKALGDAITREQWDTGAIPTHWSFKETDDSIWMNCHVFSALTLGELARAVARR